MYNNSLILLLVFVLFHFKYEYYFVKSDLNTQAGNNSKSSIEKSSKNIQDDKENCDPDFPWPQIRLPVLYQPENYFVNLRPDFLSNSFQGDVTIDIVVNNDSKPVSNEQNWLILHAEDLKITSAAKFSIAGKGEKAVVKNVNSSGDKMRFCSKNAQIALKLPKILDMRTKFSVRLEFTSTGNISGKLDGLYKSTYVSKDGKLRKEMLVTQFEPVSARKMFPCFDEPSFKAHFTLSVVRPKNMISLSNSPKVKTELFKTSHQTNMTLYKDTFEQTVKMSTYLLALAVCDYGNLSAQTLSKIQVTAYAPPHQIEQTGFALNTTVRALEFFEKFFGLPYPLAKMDVIAINDFQFGAMENWGLVTFSDLDLLHEPSKATILSKERVAIVVVHEISHQWFGNLVTIKWWNDLWLNEGFASYLELFATDALFPDWNLMTTFIVDIIESAQSLDGLVHTHPVSSKIQHPDDIESAFDDISYSKGASLIRSLANLIGVDQLSLALKEYLNAFKYSNAEEEDLWKYLNKHSTGSFPNDLTISDYMSNFTKQPGYPLIEISRKNGKLFVNQTRFYYLERELKKKHNETWHIPISIRTDLKKSVSNYWLKKNESMIIENPDFANMEWFKANVNKTGFYRVNYDTENWSALFKRLIAEPDILPASDRTDLIGDAFAMVTVGKLKLKLVLDFLRQFLIKETSRSTWRLLFEQFYYLESILRQSEAYPVFWRFAVDTLTPIYLKWDPWNIINNNAKSTFEINKNISQEMKIVQLAVLKLSCIFDVGDCRQRAASKFRRYLDFNETLDPNIRLEACKYALINNSELYDKIFDLFNRSVVPDEKRTYLGCLTATTSYWRLWSLLNMTLEGSVIKSSWMPRVFNFIVSNQPDGLLDVWYFYRKNYGNIKSLISPITMSYIIKSFDVFHTEFDLAEFDKFLAKENLGPAKAAFEQTKEHIEINAQFLKMNEYDLKTYYYSPNNM